MLWNRGGMILVYRGLVSINITLLTDLASSETGCLDQYVLPSTFDVNRPAPRSDSATRCPAPAGPHWSTVMRSRVAQRSGRPTGHTTDPSDRQNGHSICPVHTCL